MNEPFVFKVSVPSLGNVTMTAVNGLFSTSVSFTSTPGTFTISVVSSAVV